MKISLKPQRLWSIYYIILFGTCVFSMFRTSFQVGTFSVFVMMILILTKLSIFKRWCKQDVLLIFYVFWCVASIVWSVGNNRMSNFMVSFGYTLMPSCFYLWAKTITKEDSKKCLNIFIQSIFFSMLFGLLLYILVPNFYGDFLVLKRHIPNNTTYQIRKIFSGIFGPTITGSLCTIGAIYELRRFLYVNKKKWYRLLILSVLLIMTARKSAIAVFMLFALYEVLHSIRVNKNNIVRIVVLSIMIVILSAFLISRYPEILQEVLNRFNLQEFSYGLSIRDEWNSNSLKNMQSVLYGNGFGAAGHRAGVYNGATVTVYDNSYMLILCETGIVGLILFVLFNFFNINAALKNINACKFELEVVLILLVQAFTSNIFELLYLTPIYWFCLGRCAIAAFRIEEE